MTVMGMDGSLETHQKKHFDVVDARYGQEQGFAEGQQDGNIDSRHS